MTPLEMNACGRPVVAYAAGGALETVVDGVTGVLAGAQEASSLAAAMQRSEALTFSAAILRAHAERFARPIFVRELQTIVSELREQHYSSVADR
jgi:glycosyltransferase involved in cell wall biosynthesis